MIKIKVGKIVEWGRRGRKGALVTIGSQQIKLTISELRKLKLEAVVYLLHHDFDMGKK